MLESVKVDASNSTDSSSSICEDFLTNNNITSQFPTLASFTIKPQLTDLVEKKLLENVFLNGNYEKNFLSYKIHFEFFIKKYLKKENISIFNKYEHIKVKKGSTATYRCKNYRNKQLKCKCKLTFKYNFHSDSVLFSKINHLTHLEKCVNLSFM